VGAIRLYFRYVAASIRSQMQFPASLAMLALAQFGGTLIEFGGIWALFNRFGKIKGWTLGEVALFYGIVSVTFALADTISRGFDVFGPEFVKTGNFDRLLLRPRAAALQLLGHEFRLTRIGRLLQGLLVLAIAANLAEIEWTLPAAILLLAAITGGIALFVGILVLQATLAFWTVESLEMANILTYGGVEAAQYPLDIYSRWLRDFLIFVVPIGCVTYFPAVRLLRHPEPLGAPAWLLDSSPIFGFLFLAVSLVVWRQGVRHYTSTGS
jgi:viologen exporter family transport system permease protein